jgi:hypothetical protein
MPTKHSQPTDTSPELQLTTTSIFPVEILPLQISNLRCHTLSYTNMVYTGRAWPSNERPTFIKTSDLSATQEQGDDTTNYSTPATEAVRSDVLDVATERLAESTANTQDDFLYRAYAASDDKDIILMQVEAHRARQSQDLVLLKDYITDAFKTLERISIVVAKLGVRAAGRRHEHNAARDSNLAGAMAVEMFKAASTEPKEDFRKARKEKKLVRRSIQGLKTLRPGSPGTRPSGSYRWNGDSQAEKDISDTPDFRSIASQLSSVADYGSD